MEAFFKSLNDHLQSLLAQRASVDEQITAVRSALNGAGGLAKFLESQQAPEPTPADE